jgi:hypothetical protein
MVATDTPNKLEIEAQHQVKMEKKRKKDEKINKKLFVDQNKKVKLSKKKKVTEASESSDSDFFYQSESEGEVSHALEEEEVSHVLEKEVKVEDWIVVKFSTKKTVRRFVGVVIEWTKKGENLTVRFAKKVDESRFKWPEQEDISEIDVEQIDARLNPPEFSFQNDRVTSFVFKDKFSNVIE